MASSLVPTPVMPKTATAVNRPALGSSKREALGHGRPLETPAGG